MQVWEGSKRTRIHEIREVSAAAEEEMPESGDNASDTSDDCVRDFIDRKDFPYWLKEIENTALFNDEDDEVVTERLKEMEGPMLCLLYLLF